MWKLSNINFFVMHCDILNTHIHTHTHAHTNSLALSLPLPRLSLSLSLLNINMLYQHRRNRTSMVPACVHCLQVLCWHSSSTSVHFKSSETLLWLLDNFVSVRELGVGVVVCVCVCVWVGLGVCVLRQRRQRRLQNPSDLHANFPILPPDLFKFFFCI